MSDVGQSASAHHYQGESGRSYHRGKRALPEAAYDWVARLRAEKFRDHLGEASAVVEIGAGAGWNLAALGAPDRIAVDVADFLADDLRARGITFTSTSSSLGDHTADAVICHHALEHVSSPMDVLLEIRRLLRPGGPLLLFVPYEVERRFRRYHPDEPNHHLYSWNVQTMAALVAESGYDIVAADIGPYGYDRAAAIAATRLRIGERGFRLVRRLAQLVKPVREVRIVATPRLP